MVSGYMHDGKYGHMPETLDFSLGML